MGQLHRTAMGKLVDMEALVTANEHVIAVGNMNVNARGDEIGPGGQVIRSVHERLAEHYNNVHTMVPTDDVVPTNAKSAQQVAADVLEDPDFDEGEEIVETVAPVVSQEPAPAVVAKPKATKKIVAPVVEPIVEKPLLARPINRTAKKPADAAPVIEPDVIATAPVVPDAQLPVGTVEATVNGTKTVDTNSTRGNLAQALAQDRAAKEAAAKQLAANPVSTGLKKL